MLIFDPEATLVGVERNIDFIEAFADIPSNFCRAEVYAGTPLKAILEQSGRLDGDYFAWTYRDARPAGRGAVPHRDDRVLLAQLPSGRRGQPEHGHPRRQ